MTLSRPTLLTFAATVLAAGVLLAGCSSTPVPSPSATVSVTPKPIATTTPTPTPTPPETPAPTPVPQPAEPSSYDLEAAYATCLQYATDGVRGMTGTFKPFDPADTNPIADEMITTDVSDDPNALMMHVFWESDTSELTSATFCSISGPFDAPVVTFERGSSNA